MLVRHSMVRGPRSVAPEEFCSDVLNVFRVTRIRHAPVVVDGELVGIVSERDLTRTLPGTIGGLEGEEGRVAASKRVGSVMARNVETCGPNDPIDAVALRMEELRIGCMPVVEERRLVGIVTSNDLLRGFADHVTHHPGRPITLVWNQGEGTEPPDVAMLCVESGLRLTTLLESQAQSGARVFLLRVSGSDPDVQALLDACRAASLGIIVGQAAA